MPNPVDGDRDSNPWYAAVEPVKQESVLVDLAPTDAAARRRKKQASGARSLVEWVAVIAGALLVAVLIRTLFLQTFYIPSESMETTLLKNDRVLVNKLSYKVHDVHRGDVVVFKRPPKEANTEIKDLIKRVIGLPGETVQGRDGKVVIDGRELNEPYVDAGKTTSDFGPIKIPAGMVFVMGDNRPNSQDSRFFGPIEQNLIVGRAFVKIWPLGRMGWL
jgi:signal peptidase I